MCKSWSKLPEEINDVRNDAIIATGRSDYPNQVIIWWFPYVFRGALDVRSKTIKKRSCCCWSYSKTCWRCSRWSCGSHGGERPHYGKDYIIPSTFDPRLISVIPAAVAKAAIESEVAEKIDNFEIYKEQQKKD